MTLDEVFCLQSASAAVKHELDADMATSIRNCKCAGHRHCSDAKVKSAMNDINAAQREQVAANARGEAEKFWCKEGRSRGGKQSSPGTGDRKSRKAIIEGFSLDVEQFQSGEGASAKKSCS